MVCLFVWSLFTGTSCCYVLCCRVPVAARCFLSFQIWQSPGRSALYCTNCATCNNLWWQADQTACACVRPETTGVSDSQSWRNALLHCHKMFCLQTHLKSVCLNCYRCIGGWTACEAVHARTTAEQSLQWLHRLSLLDQVALCLYQCCEQHAMST